MLGTRSEEKKVSDILAWASERERNWWSMSEASKLMVNLLRKRPSDVTFTRKMSLRKSCALRRISRVVYATPYVLVCRLRLPYACYTLPCRGLTLYFFPFLNK